MRKTIIDALSLVNQPLPPLTALLRPLDESCNPWCGVLCDDRRELAAHCPSKLGHLGDSESDRVVWHAFMLNDSGVLLRLARGLTDFTSELASVAVHQVAHEVDPAELGGLLKCPDCSPDFQRVFVSSKALQTHRMCAHHYRNPDFSAVAPGERCCWICKTE